LKSENQSPQYETKFWGQKSWLQKHKPEMGSFGLTRHYAIRFTPGYLGVDGWPPDVA
jgi:hypothetical protein